MKRPCYARWRRELETCDSPRQDSREVQPKTRSEDSLLPSNWPLVQNVPTAVADTERGDVRTFLLDNNSLTLANNNRDKLGATSMTASMWRSSAPVGGMSRSTMLKMRPKAQQWSTFAVMFLGISLAEPRWPEVRRSLAAVEGKPPEDEAEAADGREDEVGDLEKVTRRAAAS